MNAPAAHALTESEREAFERDGFLLLPHVMPAALVDQLNQVTDRLDAEYRAGEGVGPHHLLNLHDLIELDDAFLDVVDLATTLPKVLGILGWNIQLFHTQLVVTPPAPLAAGRGGYGWHQDNNRMNLDFETPPPHPRVSVKLGFFLTDALDEDLGTLAVVPGSHTRGRPEIAIGDQPEGAMQVLGRAGDAVLFDRRIWHASTINHGSASRRMLYYGYSYRWLRTKSAMAFEHLYGQLNPVRRQLLGWATSANGRFEPLPDDVPLRDLC